MTERRPTSSEVVHAIDRQVDEDYQRKHGDPQCYLKGIYLLMRHFALEMAEREELYFQNRDNVDELREARDAHRNTLRSAAPRNGREDQRRPARRSAS